ncbi:MAG: YoaK family protein [Thiohalocapsa sp.]
MTDQGWRQVVSAWLLVVAGGSVDAVVLLGFNVLTAAQTGNTMLLAVALARGDAVGGISAALSVLAFVLGVTLGAVLLRRVATNPASLLPTLLTEAVLLGGLLGFWISVQPLSRHEELGVIALAALAMGLQSALALHLRGPSTTYMTGTLATFSTGLVEWMLARVRGPDLTSMGTRPAPRPRHHAPGPAASPGSYTCQARLAAVFCSCTLGRWPCWSPLVPFFWWCCCRSGPALAKQRKPDSRCDGAILLAAEGPGDCPVGVQSATAKRRIYQSFTGSTPSAEQTCHFPFDQAIDCREPCSPSAFTRCCPNHVLADLDHAGQSANHAMGGNRTVDAVT